jgi:uncharacterized YigZ family protein
MDKGYKVCKKDCTTEFIEKKSRFISYLACVTTEAEAKAFIESVSAKHKDATHNCYAYRLRTPRVERFSDNGEPAGTAGMPMLEVMKKEDVYDTCVVVTRYFGGILLGGGGLIRAYSRGVSDALSESGFAVRLACRHIRFKFGYTNHARFHKLLETTTHNLIDEEFSDSVTVTLSLIADEADAFVEKVVDLMCGDVVTELICEDYDSFN